MSKWRVFGSATISIVQVVEADDEEQAIERAHEEFEGLTGYAGNGGRGDKLIGVTDSAASLYSDDCDYEFNEADPIS